MDLKRSLNDREVPLSKKQRGSSSISGQERYGQMVFPQPVSKGNSNVYSGAKGPVNTVANVGKIGDDRQDTEQLQDALISAGVDIKEEEHNMSRSYDYVFGSNVIPLEEDRTKMTDFLNPVPLNDLIYRIAISNSLKTIDPDIGPLLALSLRDRMASLLSEMIVLSRHRTASLPVNRKIIDNVGKILEDINIKEKDKEEKRRAQILSRKMEEESKMDKQTLLSGNPEDMDKKRKKKEMLMNSSSKNLSEDAQKRNIDTTAAIMMGSGPNGPGGKKYSWMTSTLPLSPGYVTKTPRTTSNHSQASTETAIIQTVEEIGLITIRDALNVLEMDREGAGEIFGRGARALSRGYIRLKD
ncbi:hypothetical protein T552_01571 [Pneumocystis carinii B80]|uniref:Transcription initiation factor TFIID subunit 4 n=1 Tax=Pneumocystis carinii (strain B80) TaxID=1408658 RepID=A0A0W4ZKQ7_PNEC8|nr:hypothetical protein T552_01571 [Pneumocystis carinii B80]KTW28942.1 hypothetical protein T552_01571 [Pneumocystis carinii B80]